MAFALGKTLLHDYARRASTLADLGVAVLLALLTCTMFTSSQFPFFDIL